MRQVELAPKPPGGNHHDPACSCRCPCQRNPSHLQPSPFSCAAPTRCHSRHTGAMLDWNANWCSQSDHLLVLLTCRAACQTDSIDFNLARLYLGPPLRLVDLAISISSFRISAINGVSRGWLLLFLFWRLTWQTLGVASDTSSRISDRHPGDLQKRSTDTLHDGSHSHRLCLQQTCG
jgi:hypothetical protein